MTEKKSILEFHDITKSFPGVKALDSINIDFNYGEIHALVGENGAGKSTLMKILSGVYKPDGGEIFYHGKKIVLHNPHQAQMAGISIIFQEFSLIPYMSVAENVYLNREPVSKTGFLKNNKLKKSVIELMEKLDIKLDIELPVSELPVVQQQLVEIIKALSIDAKIIIMDEPSATLTDKEIKKLFSIITSLKEKGVTVIYISHMLEEIFEIADRVTVIKDGIGMGTYHVSDMTKKKLVELMVGRDIRNIYPELGKPSAENILEVKNLNVENKLSDISFTLKKGEILGLAGMVGSGRSLLVKSVLGLHNKTSGEILYNSEKVAIANIKDAINLGFCYIPSDRKKEGIIASMDIIENTTISSLDDYLVKAGIINKGAEKKAVQEQIASLRTKTPSLYTKIETLSGGNQQKVLISRAFLSKPQIYVIVEPTRGIDVGAKYEIYKIIRDLTLKGNSVIMISSELPEIIGMSDRIIVLNRGKITGIIEQKNKISTEEEILSLAVGHEYSFKKAAN